MLQVVLFQQEKTITSKGSRSLLVWLLEMKFLVLNGLGTTYSTIQVSNSPNPLHCKLIAILDSSIRVSEIGQLFFKKSIKNNKNAGLSMNVNSWLRISSEALITCDCATLGPKKPGMLLNMCNMHIQWKTTLCIVIL